MNSGQFRYQEDTGLLYYKRVEWFPIGKYRDGELVGVFVDIKFLPGVRKLSRYYDMRNVILIPLGVENPSPRDVEKLVYELLSTVVKKEVYEVLMKCGLSVVDTICQVKTGRELDLSWVFDKLVDRYHKYRKYSFYGMSVEEVEFSLSLIEHYRQGIKIGEYMYTVNKGGTRVYKYIW